MMIDVEILFYILMFDFLIYILLIKIVMEEKQ